MAARDEVIAYADELLELERYPDYGPMGLQVVGADTVEKIACAVSASLEAFERATAAGAQLLLVHHGILWSGDPLTIDLPRKRRLEALFRGNLSLAAYHLALDAHPEIGNNALLARALGVEVDRAFDVGHGGRLADPTDVDTFAARVETALGHAPLVFPFGPRTIERAAICSGGAGKLLERAAGAGYDLYLTGEPEEPSRAIAKERGIHFVAAGHHATERLGIQALAQRLAAEFDLEWEYLEVDNPV